MSILTNLDHPNVIRTYGYDFQVDARSSYISVDVIFEHTRTSLLEYLSHQYLTTQEKIKMLVSIADGLIYLADQNITKFELRVGRYDPSSTFTSRHQAFC